MFAAIVAVVAVNVIVAVNDAEFVAATVNSVDPQPLLVKLLWKTESVPRVKDGTNRAISSFASMGAFRMNA